MRYPPSGRSLSLFFQLGLGACLALFFLFGLYWLTDYPELDPQALEPSPGEEVALREGVDGEARDVAALGTDAEDVDAPEEKPGVHRRLVQEGDTVAAILQEWLDPAGVQAVIEAAKPHFSLSRILIGNEYVVTLEEGRFKSFDYAIDDFTSLVVEREGEGFAGRLVRQPMEVRLERLFLDVNSSLFETVAAAGEKASLAVALSEIFRWEVNFIKHLRPGDTFEVLLEKRYLDGEFKGYGEILAVYFINQGKRHEAFRFTPKGGRPQYFAASGESLKRAFLKAPLSFSRISSGYSMRRLHPITKVVRPHPGVDYAAPTGTPVRAVGSGQVTFAGWGGPAGRYVKIAHANGYESTYMHLSGFARGLKKGKGVAQGQIIGYVGMTGAATGPHLDFRLKKNGRFLNPLTVVSPRADGLPKGQLPAFHERVNLFRAYLEGRRPPGEWQSAKKI